MPQRPEMEPELERELEQAVHALEDGRFEEAATRASAVLEKDPKSLLALMLRAEVSAELGDLDAAERDYRQARKVAPDDLEVALDFTDFLLSVSEGDHEVLEEALTVASKARKRAAKEGDVELEFEFLVLEGTIFNQLGECTAALEVLETALNHVPKSLEARTERALALFELCRFADAQKALEELITLDPKHAWAHHHLGMISERRGEEIAAKTHFETARSLAPEEFFSPIQLGDGEFDRIVEAAIAELPGNVRQFLENVTIAVEPIPSEEDLAAETPPLSPAILGVFRGVPVGERSVTSSFDHMTSSIVLYQRNLERFAKSREELIEQISITVLHEVGHLVGLDEDDLRDRGLD